jgi:hypothetical protein
MGTAFSPPVTGERFLTNMSAPNNNIVSLKAFRTLKECQKLFSGYKERVEKMEKVDLLIEMERYQKEASNYPHHLLTVVKGEILMAAVRDKSLSHELLSFAQQEERRLKIELYRRLQEEWSGKAN